MKYLVTRATKRTQSITALPKEHLSDWLGGQSAGVRAWVEASGFKADPGQVCRYPQEDGSPGGVLMGLSTEPDPYSFSILVGKLPAGRYRFDESLPQEFADLAALGWALATYRFDRYKEFKKPLPELVWPEGANKKEVTFLAEAVCLARDLINTPAEDMGPDALAEEAKQLAKKHKATCKFTVGQKLLDNNYPTIHAVGRAGPKEPRLIDMRWGKRNHPKLTLVGKGVCFDSGGLDLKPASGMLLMKKDMGGSAIVLGLAHAIMSANLPVRLRVLVPAVENSVSANSFRPMDVIKTRKGLTVEVGNTDAEGRLILCDALAEADSESPDLVVDFATLTGAARIALGTDLPALFVNDDQVAEAFLKGGKEAHDPYWRMPLHAPYRGLLDSKVADLSNIGGSYGGAITAALFLQSFLSEKTKWVHVDVMAWNQASKPGRPAGGEGMGIRGAFKALQSLFG